MLELFHVLIHLNQFSYSQFTSLNISSIIDEKLKGETPSSKFVTSVTRSMTNICYCVQYVFIFIFKCNLFYVFHIPYMPSKINFKQNIRSLV